MGVSIYPGGASWSYGGFNRFRERLASEEGFDLTSMEGFGGSREWTTTNGDYITTLAPLLKHSDCDGYLHSYECELVIPRLSAILASWANGDVAADRAYDMEQGTALLDAMQHSVEHGCAVVFS